MDIYYLYSDEINGFCTLKLSSKHKSWRFDIFDSEEKATEAASFISNAIGIKTAVKKSSYKDYMEYVKEDDERAFYPSWLKEKLVNKFLSQKEKSNSISLRKFSVEHNIPYYTFRDWYRDLKNKTPQQEKLK